MELLFVAPGFLLQAGIVMGTEQVEMVFDDVFHIGQPRRLWIELFQLQQQALSQVPGSDANRIESLDTVQHGFDLIEFDIEFIFQAIVDIFDTLGQVAVVINSVDDGDGDDQVIIAEL